MKLHDSQLPVNINNSENALNCVLSISEPWRVLVWSVMSEGDAGAM